MLHRRIVAFACRCPRCSLECRITADRRPDMLKTPLDSLHRELGARMVPFAGYDMPVQYPAGILAEHTHTREAAG